MYEFHGWATICESTSEIDQGGLYRIVQQLKAFIAKQNWNSGMLEIRAINGSYNLCVCGLTNHKSQEAVDVMNLYEYIGKIAPGSYGLLYTKDDEDTNGFDNEFVVFILARGTITKSIDSFLSPFIPKVEDEY